MTHPGPLHSGPPPQPGPPPASPAGPADPDLVELTQLDQVIPGLAAHAEHARQAWAMADQALAAARRQREQVMRRLGQRAALAAKASNAAPGWPGVPPQVPAEAVPAGRAPEASTHTFQNALFILGGLLLCIAAVVFTAVAWAAYGVGGRAAILGVATALALAIPVVALWRHLRATAETFAGVGLVLVALDGYAAWYVNLFGVNALPGTRYAGLVCAVTAAVATGYGLLTRLTGPGITAAVVFQPAIPLFAAEYDLGVTGWSMVLSACAAANLLVVFVASRRRSGAAVRAFGWLAAALWWLVAGLFALLALLAAQSVVEAARAGLAVLLLAVLLALAAAVSGFAAAHQVAAAGVVLATALAGLRVASLAWPAHLLVAAAAIVAVVSLGVVALRRLTPATARFGATIMATVLASMTAVVLVGLTLIVAARTVSDALPMWRADLSVSAWSGWQLLAALGLTAVAFGAVLADLVRMAATAVRRAAPEAVAGPEAGAVTEAGTEVSGAPVWAGWLDVLVVAGSLAVLALPGALPLLWWAPSVVDMSVAALLFGLVVLARSWRYAAVPALVAAVALAGHAVLAGLARPALTAAMLGAVAALGLAIAVLSQRRPRFAVRQVVGGPALLVGLAAVPPAVGSALESAGLPVSWVIRLTSGTILLLLAAQAATSRYWPAARWYAFAAVLVSALVWPTVGAVDGGDPIGIYAGSALVLIAAALLPVRGGLPWAGAAAVPAAVLFAVDVVPVVLSVVVAPYAWFEAVWSGAPRGVGLSPSGTGPVEITAAHAVSLGLLAVASTIATFAVRRRMRAALAGLTVGGPTAVIVALVAAGARWPVVPAATLLLGIVMLSYVACVQIGQLRTAIGGSQAALYVGAGLSGALTVKWSTLAGLGSIVVAATVVGMVGRSVAWRLAGWLTAVAAALATAAAAGLAAELPIRNAAFAVLATAVAALAVGATLRPAAESKAVQGAAHAGGVLAVLLTVTSAGHCAAACSLWGIAVGLRALWPGTGRQVRAVHATMAAAWQLLAWWLWLGARDVTLVEAYTVPLAAVALLAGWVALRARPELRSWMAYGPALAAAFLPSLALVLSPDSDNSAWRRLLLGLGALAVVFGGAVRRRQAPVVVGGAVAILVALHELALVWDLLPRWIPLAAGGLLLVGLAITYERRRRDVAWLRATLGRMQ